MQSDRVDYLVLAALACFAIAASFVLHATFIVSAFLFFGLPSIYLLARTKLKRLETFAAVALFGILYTFLLDYVAELNGAWAWSPSQLIFQSKILGVVSPDALLFGALWVFSLIVYYEHFADHDKKDTINRRVWYAALAGVGLLVILMWIATETAQRPYVAYAYFYFGLGSLLPLIYALWKRPALWRKFFKVAIYSVPLYFAYELTGRALGQWDFPGNYIGMIHVGAITFPVEEFMFWIIASSVAVLGSYELFIDDLR